MRTTNPAKCGGLDTTGEIKISGGSGITGQVIASQGPGVPPAFVSPSDIGVDYGLSFLGTVSGIAGAPNFQCSNLVGFGNDFFEGYWAYVVWDAAGGGAAPQGEALVCTGYDSATGDFTVAAFSAAIAVGDKVLLIHPRLAEILAIKTQTDKLAGAAPVVGTTAAMNLFAGVATSGETGADLVTLGADNVKNKVLSLLIDSTGVTAAAIITVRMYQQINGTARKVYSQQFLMGTDTVGLWIIQAAVGIHEALRVEVQSSAAGDVNVTLGYDAMIEVM